MRKDVTLIVPEVSPGNSGGKTAFLAVKRRRKFGIDKVIFVADRFMIGPETLAVLKGSGFE
jgi:hypothetical protein